MRALRRDEGDAGAMRKAVRLEEILEQARRLSILDKIRLIERVTPEIERELRVAQGGSARRPSLWALCADLGSAPSADDIDRSRQEAWQGFPRDDI